jgi:outer membrane protein TolC
MKYLFIIFIYILLITSLAGQETEVTVKIDLKKCIENSLSTDLTLKEAHADVSVAKGQLRQARSGLFPSLSAAATYSKRNQVPEFTFPGGLSEGIIDENQHDVTFTMKYLLYDGGGVSSLSSQAEANLEGYEINEEKTKQDVIYKAAMSYFNALRWKNFVHVAEESVDLSKQQLELAKSRFDAGTAAKADVLKADAQLSESEIKLIDAKNYFNIALSSLNDTMGLSLTTPLELSENYVYSEWNITLEQCQNKAMKERLEIEIIEKTKTSLYYATEFAKSAWYPSIFLKLDYTPYGNSLITQNNTLVGTVGAQFNIFDGFKTGGNIDEAEAKYEKVTIREEDVKKKVTLDVQKSFLTFRSNSKKVLEVEKNLDASKESFRVAQISYREGISSFIDVNQAQLVLINAEVSKVQAIYDYYVAKLDLLRATGYLKENFDPSSLDKN